MKKKKERILNKSVTDFEVPKYEDEYLNKNPHAAELADKKKGPTAFASWLKASEEKIKRENEIKKQIEDEKNDPLPSPHWENWDYREYRNSIDELRKELELSKKRENLRKGKNIP